VKGWHTLLQAVFDRWVVAVEKLREGGNFVQQQCRCNVDGSSPLVVGDALLVARDRVTAHAVQWAEVRHVSRVGCARGVD
jgi:hypothetical protein